MLRETEWGPRSDRKGRRLCRRGSVEMLHRLQQNPAPHPSFIVILSMTNALGGIAGMITQSFSITALILIVLFLLVLVVMNPRASKGRSLPSGRTRTPPAGTMTVAAAHSGRSPSLSAPVRTHEREGNAHHPRAP